MLPPNLLTLGSLNLSIPSPDYAWQVFNLGQWLRDLGLSWFGLNITIHTYALCILVGHRRRGHSSPATA